MIQLKHPSFFLFTTCKVFLSESDIIRLACYELIEVLETNHRFKIMILDSFDDPNYLEAMALAHAFRAHLRHSSASWNPGNLGPAFAETTGQRPCSTEISRNPISGLNDVTRFSANLYDIL